MAMLLGDVRHWQRIKCGKTIFIILFAHVLPH
jgi:hypothetical protein